MIKDIPWTIRITFSILWFGFLLDICINGSIGPVYGAFTTGATIVILINRPAGLILALILSALIFVRLLAWGPYSYSFGISSGYDHFIGIDLVGFLLLILLSRPYFKTFAKYFKPEEVKNELEIFQQRVRFYRRNLSRKSSADLISIVNNVGYNEAARQAARELLKEKKV